jgi:DnaJ-domain-containing protein 1
MSGMPPTMEFNRPLGEFKGTGVKKIGKSKLASMSENIRGLRNQEKIRNLPARPVTLALEAGSQRLALPAGNREVTSGGNAAPISNALFGGYVNPNPFERRYSQTETAKPAARELTREDHLRVLGLTPGASNTEILAARNKALKMYHPDRLTNPRTKQPYSAATKREHAKKLSNINAAFSSLGIKP